MYKDEEFKNLIYELISGDRNLKEYPVKESENIVNEFGEGMYCCILYEQVYKANQSLCDKLHTNEDADIECIISNLLSIAKYLSMKMYDYGVFYATESNDHDINEILRYYDLLTVSEKADFMEFVQLIGK